MNGKELRDTQLTVIRQNLPPVKRGVVYVLFAFELGLSINLDAAALKIKEGIERAQFSRHRKTPRYFDYDPPPLRVLQHGQQINAGKFFTRPQVDLTLFDFGACSVCYEIEVSGPLSHLIELSVVLYDNAFLLADARERVKLLMDAIDDAIVRPNLRESVEDFSIFHFEQFEGDPDFRSVLQHHPKEFARLLRAESDDLGDEQIDDAVSIRTSYSNKDCVVVDWNSAIFFGTSVEDVVAVLEFCNAELLEMRLLDEQLDDHLGRAYQILTTGSKAGGDLNKIARLQVDSAILYEAVENALKLLGDQYLARLYSLASNRFHLPEWEGSIRRKLDTLDSIYQKLSDRAAQRRSEVLEWIVILLIGFEIVLSIWEKLGTTAH